MAAITAKQGDTKAAYQRYCDFFDAAENFDDDRPPPGCINTAFTEGGLELAEFKELKTPLIVQKAVLQQKLAKTEQGTISPIEPIKKLILQANQAEKWMFENDWLKRKSFLQKVGLNRQIRSQTLTVTFKKRWNSLSQTTVAARCAASESERNSIWWSRGESNP